MKKDCASTRKSLRKYLRGHVFKYEQVRIARHLSVCPLCRSEFQALQKVADTRQLLKDITPPDGIRQHMKAKAAGLERLKVFLYRPLWMVLLAVGITLIYVNVVAPRRDAEIENIEKTIPASVPVASSPTVTPETAPPPAAKAPQPAAPQESLAITIAAPDEQAVADINAAMRGHRELRKLKFSDTVRELSGSLTGRELQTFFDRIGQSAKVSYSKKRMASYPGGESIPFILKLKPLPKTADRPIIPVSAPVVLKPASASQTQAAPPAEARPPDPSEKRPDQNLTSQ